MQHEYNLRDPKDTADIMASKICRIFNRILDRGVVGGISIFSLFNLLFLIIVNFMNFFFFQIHREGKIENCANCQEIIQEQMNTCIFYHLLILSIERCRQYLYKK